MFGTIAHTRLKEGVTIEQVRALFGDENRPAAAVSLIVFQSESDPRDLWIASAFESREAYFKNSDSPEQQARFQAMQALFEGQPEWHDGNVVTVINEDRVRSAS